MAVPDSDQLDSDQLDTTFAALANPVRRAILARLATGEATVSALAEPFEMTMPAISRHLRILEHAGLISRGQRAQYRPCRLNPEPLAAVTAWADQHRATWEASFDRMDDYLEVLQIAATPPTQRNTRP